MARTAKLFKNGRSQAVRLPKEFRMPGSEVYIERRGHEVILRPKQTMNWDDFFSQPSRFPRDFMANRKDLKLQKRRMF
jgi:antitoxin VapB